jgi:hypothetical protein
MGRFSKYASSDFPELWKPEVGEEREVKLLGTREYDGKDGVVPVLDLEPHPNGGEPFSYMAGPWRARVALDRLDPPDGAVLTIRRLPDIGMSHDIEIAFAGPDAVEIPY